MGLLQTRLAPCSPYFLVLSWNDVVEQPSRPLLSPSFGTGQTHQTRLRPHPCHQHSRPTSCESMSFSSILCRFRREPSGRRNTRGSFRVLTDTPQLITSARELFIAELERTAGVDPGQRRWGSSLLSRSVLGRRGSSEQHAREPPTSEQPCRKGGPAITSRGDLHGKSRRFE